MPRSARWCKGPWRNAKGVVVAKNVAELHSAKNNLTKNSSHGTRGCSQENLVGTGGAGLFYCFAAK
jgi:hypothetical protein